MSYSIIAAIGKNNEMGKDNQLLWHLPSDLKFFKETTLNHTVIMGKNTYLSIGRPLPKRTNIVLSSSLEDDRVIVCKSLEEIKNYINEDEEIFIIGGYSIYKTFLPLASKLYLTHINKEFDADVFFPEVNYEEYTSEIIDEGIENNLEYKHVLYKRKTKE